jgi:hypothetical protein
MKMAAIAAIFALILLAVAFAGFCFDFTLQCCIGYDIPFWADCLAGVAASSVNLPAAVACLVAILCGVPTPFFI